VVDAYDPLQKNTHFVYDGLNRATQVTHTHGTPALTYTYDQARSGYFNQGRLTTATTAAVGGTPQTTQEFDYDKMGRIAAQREKIGATTYTLSYAYNLGGLLKREVYPSGRTMLYAFDEAGQLSGVTDSLGATYANGYSYAAQGALTSETFGNGFVRSLSYNNALQPK
jgi:YD repeat-containing protein